MADVQVQETKRTVILRDGVRATFHNVEWFNSEGSFLRLGCDEGYVLINQANILYIVVDGDRVR